MKNRTIYLNILCFIAFVFLIQTSHQAAAYTESGNISLLTVSESDNHTAERGGVAKLYLMIKPGTGRIFIDSFPLSKVDTQITMRFAAELACNFLNKDCSGYDFFYTIRANSAIVGGPSAGAAATVLTVAMLDEQKLDEKTVMTGTINSGNLIGPVAGVNAKTLAAQHSGFTKALIPKWDVVNESLDPAITIEVVPVSTLEEALEEFTGKNYNDKNYDIRIPSEYLSTMNDIAGELCTKYGSITADGITLMPNISDTLLRYEMPNLLEHDDPEIFGNDSNDSANTSVKSFKDFFALAGDAMEKKEYYSAAGYCFGGNVRISIALLSNKSSNDLKLMYAQLLADISSLEEEINSTEISSIPALETYMIVSERLMDAKSALESYNPENLTGADMAYASERLYTARIWSRFFTLSGSEYKMDEELLKQVCTNKLSEAEERINYLQLFMPRTVDRDDLKQAYTYFDEEKYALCIFTASKAKADADVILGAIYVSEDNLKSYLDEKLIATKKVIATQQENGIFPILGYSYYEYANSLKRTETYSALIYAEYALELSNIDMYFPVKKDTSLYESLDKDVIPPFLYGFSAGILFIVLILLLLSWFKICCKAKAEAVKDKTLKKRNARRKK